MAKKKEEDPWWHENAAEFASDEADESEDEGAADSSELLTTATQEAFKLASTLSTWAEQSGFGDVVRSVAQQAVGTAQLAASTLADTGKDAEPGDEVDLARTTTDEIDLDGIDLDSEEFAHLDNDPADAHLVRYNAVDGTELTNHLGHGNGHEEVRITCDYCPVCRIIESLDDLNPETAAAIAEIMAVVTDGLAAAVADLVPKNTSDD